MSKTHKEASCRRLKQAFGHRRHKKQHRCQQFPLNRGTITKVVFVYYDLQANLLQTFFNSSLIRIRFLDYQRTFIAVHPVYSTDSLRNRTQRQCWQNTKMKRKESWPFEWCFLPEPKNCFGKLWKNDEDSSNLVLWLSFRRMVILFKLLTFITFFFLHHTYNAQC